jgi:hypothetical protein
MTRDLRKYASQTTFRVTAGAILLLFVVGVVLIGLIYGLPAALFGLLCLLGAFVPIGMILFVIYGMDWIVKRANRD